MVPSPIFIDSETPITRSLLLACQIAIVIEREEVNKQASYTFPADTSYAYRGSAFYLSPNVCCIYSLRLQSQLAPTSALQVLQKKERKKENETLRSLFRIDLAREECLID